ncbi:MAG TPA: hypothetical protein VF469_23510 [Kofleriaceae bacterium]
MIRPARAAALWAGLVTGCSRPASRPVAAPLDKPTRDEDTRLIRMHRELDDDILTSYDRDEAPDVPSGMIDPRIGAVRIGVRPADVYLADEVAHAPSRWPLEVDRSIRTEVRSKHLESWIALDQTAAWMSDEVSWRIQMCKRTAVIPLRITALYAQDGDRWIPVVEHLSFAFPPVPDEGQPPRAIKTEVASGDLRDELSGVVARGVLRAPHDPSVAAQTDDALVLGPDVTVTGETIAAEWHGQRVLEARLPAGTLEDRRVGVVGRFAPTATIAYWAGDYIASLPARPGVAAGKARMRVTHVFEKRWFESPGRPPTEGKNCHLEEKDFRERNSKAVEVAAHCRWVVVQSHMSQPITERELTQKVFGSALISSRPLQFDCSDGGAQAVAPAATAPGAGPRPGARPPGAGSP